MLMLELFESYYRYLMACCTYSFDPSNLLEICFRNYLSFDSVCIHVGTLVLKFNTLQQDLHSMLLPSEFMNRLHMIAEPRQRLLLTTQRPTVHRYVHNNYL